MELNPHLNEIWGRCLETFWCLTYRNDFWGRNLTPGGTGGGRQQSGSPWGTALPCFQGILLLFKPFQDVCAMQLIVKLSLCGEGSLALVTLCCSSEHPPASAEAPLCIWQMLCFLPIHGKCCFFCWGFKSSSFTSLCSCLEQCSLFLLFFLFPWLQQIFSHLEQHLWYSVPGAVTCNKTAKSLLRLENKTFMLTLFSLFKNTLVSPSFEMESWLAAEKGFLWLLWQINCCRGLKEQILHGLVVTVY